MSSNYHKSIHHSLKHTIHCIHRTELLMKLLYFIVLWNSVIAGPMLFHSDTLENKDSLPGNPVLTQTTDVNNVKNSSESTIQTETVTPVTIEETGAIVEIQNETCDDPFEEFVSPVRGTPRCCRKCDVGNGMLRLCSNTENTQCRPCKSGFEFSSVRSATKKCMQCRRCEELHPLAKTRTECTPTTDTICQCEKPFYMSEKEQTCKPCTACKPGEGIVKQCDWNSDTQCQSCPAGFWSAQTVDNVKCIPCQICEKNQILVRECSPTTDTLCCPVNNPNCTHEYALPLDYPTYDQESNMSDNGNKPNQMLPIYCSIMGLIIISLLAYVVYKLWKQREASKNAKLSDAYNIGCNKNNLLDRTTCVDNHHFQHHMISSDLLNHSPQSITEITKEASNNNNNNNNNDLILGHEKEPLLGKSVGLNNSSDCLEQPLTVVPMNILGVICYRLSQHGWQDLANTMNLDTNKFDKATASNASDLLTATLEAQETVESHLKSCNPDNLNNNNNSRSSNTHNDLDTLSNDLIMTVSLIQYIYKNNILNLGQLINYLQKLNRPDLIALIQQQQQQTVNKLKTTSGYSSEENKSRTKSMKSMKENFSIEN